MLVTGKPADEYPNELLPLLDAPEVQAEEDPTLDEWRRFLDAHFHHKFKDGPSTPTNFKVLTQGMSEKRYHLLTYLLSATLKDCSIIVRRHEDNVKSATATIIDLDPKSLGRMTKWEKLDRDVVRCTLEAEEGVEEAGKRICVEDPAVESRSVISALCLLS